MICCKPEYMGLMWSKPKCFGNIRFKNFYFETIYLEFAGVVMEGENGHQSPLGSRGCVWRYVPKKAARSGRRVLVASNLKYFQVHMNTIVLERCHDFQHYILSIFSPRYLIKPIPTTIFKSQCLANRLAKCLRIPIIKGKLKADMD